VCSLGFNILVIQPQPLIMENIMNPTTVDADAVEIPKEEVGTKKVAADNLIKNAAKWSVGAAIIPIPTVDMIALGAVQVNLVNDLARLYGTSFKNESVRAIISALLGTLIPAGAASTAMKLIPGLGMIAGAVSFAGFSAAATYAVGKVFAAHFENGGTLDNFKPETVVADLKSEFDKVVTKTEG